MKTCCFIMHYLLELQQYGQSSTNAFVRSADFIFETT